MRHYLTNNLKSTHKRDLSHGRLRSNAYLHSKNRSADFKDEEGLDSSMLPNLQYGTKTNPLTRSHQHLEEGLSQSSPMGRANRFGGSSPSPLENSMTLADRSLPSGPSKTLQKNAKQGLVKINKKKSPFELYKMASIENEGKMMHSKSKKQMEQINALINKQLMEGKTSFLSSKGKSGHLSKLEQFARYNRMAPKSNFNFNRYKGEDGKSDLCPTKLQCPSHSRDPSDLET